MADVAQTFQVRWIGKQRPVAFMIADVVHIRGPGADTFQGAFPAKWLSQELVRAKRVDPLVGLVHPAPGLSLFTAPILVFKLMILTVTAGN